jgi:flagellar motor protein MotB
MASNAVNVFSDVLFNVYNKSNLPVSRGTQNGWPYFQTTGSRRIFQAAAEPHISRIAEPAATAFPSPMLASQRSGLQAVWPVLIGALVVTCCVLALGWRASQPTLANARVQHPETDMARMWSETSQQLVQSHLAEANALSSNQTVFAASHAEIKAGLAKLTDINTQLSGSASTQASAVRELASAQSVWAQETTNLVSSLATSHAEIKAGLAKLTDIDTRLAGSASKQASAVRELASAQTEWAQETTNLVASLRQMVQEGFAEAASQSRADTVRLQTQVAEVAASQKALLDRLSAATNVANLALGLPWVRMKTAGNSVLLTFDDGLFLHGTYFKSDAKSRLRAVALALARVSTPLRIEVIGCADDDRAFKRWTAQFEESLALDRATAVVTYFMELGLFEPKCLAALSSSAANRPFPSGTAQDRARNRTAVLRISIAEKLLAGCEQAAP